MKMTRQQLLIVVTLLFIGSFANMDKSMIGLPVTAIAKDFHLQPSQTGIILSVFYVSSIAVTLPGGWFVDRYGYRMFVLISLGILAIGSFLFGVLSIRLACGQSHAVCRRPSWHHVCQCPGGKRRSAIRFGVR